MHVWCMYKHSHKMFYVLEIFFFIVHFKSHIMCAVLIWVVAFLRGAMKRTRDKKKFKHDSFSTLFLHVTLCICSVIFFRLNDGLVLICLFTPQILNFNINSSLKPQAFQDINIKPRNWSNGFDVLCSFFKNVFGLF